MNPKQTWALLIIAGILLGLILLLEEKRPATAGLLLPALQPKEISALEITYSTNTSPISLMRSNDNWFLRQPLYPAQATPIDQLTTRLASVKTFDKISAEDASIQGLPAFGLEPPLARLVVHAGTNKFDLQLGKRTPLTNHVYLKLGQDNAVFVADAAFLENLPPSRDALRERSILHLDKTHFDTLQIRSGQRVVELKRNATNAQWQITRPIPARADQIRVGLLLEQLDRSQAAAFVSDSPVGELEKYGLHAPSVELYLFRGTNHAGQLEFGGSPTNRPDFVFARLPVYSNVVLTSRALAETLNQPYKSFHDTRLVQFPLTNLSRLEIKATESFALEKISNRWVIAEPILSPADPELVATFLTNIASLQILDIARELPTEADLKTFGFDKPLASYALFTPHSGSGATATNLLLAQFEYGSNQVDTIFVRRTDEVPIYLGYLAEMIALPRRSFELRDRQLWSWQGKDIQAVTIAAGEKSARLERGQNGDWNADPVLNATIEETIHRLATARALDWIYKGDPQRLRAYGLSAPQLVYTLKDRAGVEQQIAFGSLTMKKDVYATSVLPGDKEPVVFEFSGFLFQDLLRNLPQLK